MSVRKQVPYTEAAILRRCKELFLQPDTKVFRSELDSTACSARSSYSINTDGSVSDIKIHLDHTQDGDVKCAIHELLHVALYDVLDRFNNRLEEEAVKAFEAHLYSSVTKSKRKMDMWRRLIASKIEPGR